MPTEHPQYTRVRLSFLSMVAGMLTLMRTGCCKTTVLDYDDATNVSPNYALDD